MVAEVGVLRRVAEGGSGAFWDVWAAHEAELRRLCLRFHRRRTEEAEDALATARIRAWDRWATYGPDVR
ncbi:MAG: hypothetical protein FJX72_08610, partial [Armatimonadetes bacterium]|nr:hypothetical protein [Armatimonadota bacterium]